jgi:hypothetical protein
MTQHFASQEVKVIEVPEWGEGGVSLQVYHKPFTLAEQKKLYSMSKDDNIEMLAHTLILKALDGDGKKLFTLADKVTLMHKVDPYVLARVAGEITAVDSVEDQLGN